MNRNTSAGCQVIVLSRKQDILLKCFQDVYRVFTNLNKSVLQKRWQKHLKKTSQWHLRSVSKTLLRQLPKSFLGYLKEDFFLTHLEVSCNHFLWNSDLILHNFCPFFKGFSSKFLQEFTCILFTKKQIPGSPRESTKGIFHLKFRAFSVH